ncbi:MAG: hypothetical protein ACK5PP_05560 [Acidimicrobiales bacterium]
MRQVPSDMPFPLLLLAAAGVVMVGALLLRVAPGVVELALVVVGLLLVGVAARYLIRRGPNR